jgi:hypothetical protein
LTTQPSTSVRHVIPFSTPRAARGCLFDYGLLRQLIGEPSPDWSVEAVTGHLTREALLDAMRLIPQVPPPMYFDLSHVYRPADRIAFRP